ncbi:MULTISPECIES: hypothetical protein [Chryseobacterium]|uniref:hypothetical protein n=1 Tax=Chryseobacterium TaxID=59732 RepID=UPI00162411BA|nr:MULTISPECIES: hypothetical protein [Chryseobacterium]MDM1555892.1 hypothetical protein [Chryseobacterium indologenes]
MRMQIISDLHREFGSTELCFGNADVIVMAGDVNLGTKGIEWIKEAIGFMAIFIRHAGILLEKQKLFVILMAILMKNIMDMRKN